MWYNGVRMLQEQKIMEKTGSDVDVRTIKNFPIDNPNAKCMGAPKWDRVLPNCDGLLASVTGKRLSVARQK